MKNTPKKTKKQKNKINTNIEELASNILSYNDEDEVLNDIPEIIETPTDVDQKYEDIPNQEESVVVPGPKILDRGITKDTAFIIQSHINEVDKILTTYFGSNNGDYFILNENTTTFIKNNQRKRYKCILVEDKYNYRYILWFDVTNLGLIY